MFLEKWSRERTVHVPVHFTDIIQGRHNDDDDDDTVYNYSFFLNACLYAIHSYYFTNEVTFFVIQVLYKRWKNSDTMILSKV